MNTKLLIEKAKQAGIEDIEVFIHTSKTTSLQVYEQAVDSFTISQGNSFDIRGIYQGAMGSCYVEEDADENMDWIINSIKQNAQAITSEDEVEIYAGEVAYPQLEQTANACICVDVQEKIKLLMEIEARLLQSDPRISQVMNVSYQDLEMGAHIENSKGIDVTRSDSFSVLSAAVLVHEGDDQKSAYDVMTLKNFEDFDKAAFIEKLRKKAVDKLHAAQIPSGQYPVLMEKEAMANLLRSLCGLFNGENAYKGISLLKDKAGTQIFDEKITIIDDPLRKDGYNSAPFDDEGVGCFCKALVEHGVLQGYLHNLKSAKLMHTTSSGNGFDGGISATNLYIQAGSASYEEMLASMEKGVIITELNGLHAGLNALTTEFSLQAAGFYVEHGQIVKPVNLITIAGNFLSLMKEVTMIGSDLKFQLSGIGAPSILFPAMAISGE